MEDFRLKFKNFCKRYTLALPVMILIHILLVHLGDGDGDLIGIGYIFIYMLFPASVILWLVYFLSSLPTSKERANKRNNHVIILIFNFLLSATVVLISIPSDYIPIDDLGTILIISIIIFYAILTIIYIIQRLEKNLYLLQRNMYVGLIVLLYFQYILVFMSL